MLFAGQGRGVGRGPAVAGSAWYQEPPSIDERGRSDSAISASATKTNAWPELSKMCARGELFQSLRRVRRQAAEALKPGGPML